MAWKDARGVVLFLAGALVVGIPAAVLSGSDDPGSTAAEPATAEAGPVDGDPAGHGQADTRDGHAHTPMPNRQEGTSADSEPTWRYRTSWPEATGQIPDGPEGLNQIHHLVIEGEPDPDRLREEHGIELVGDGTLEAPYVLEGLHVSGELELIDTVDHWVLRENHVDGTLRLNWNGDKVHVHHNHIRDLRVNENVERVELATAGLIEENEISIVGQIRHFDGVFTHNKVGPVPEGIFDPLITDAGELMPVPFRENLAMNIDGFDGGEFVENAIKGAVDMQLHGHHHASCFGCFSHNHGDDDDAREKDHSVRYHMGAFRANTVHADAGPAFRYQDTRHSGDDETATSETWEELESDHVHHTYVIVEGNELQGGPLVVDIFNADDPDHPSTNPGELVLKNNTVSYTVDDQTLRTAWFERWGPHGVIISDVKEMHLQVAGNQVRIEGGQETSALNQVGDITGYDPDWLSGHKPAAVHLDGASNGTLLVDGNTLAGTHYGVFATYLDEHVDWAVVGNVFEDVITEVEYDKTVESQPDR